MTFTYELGTAIGQVRFLATDTRESEYVLEDEEIQLCLTVEGSNILRAAAQALDTIATDEARVQKVQTILELKTDGAKLAEALMKRATRLRERALEAEAEEGGNFDVAEVNTGLFSENQIWQNAFLRGL